MVPNAVYPSNGITFGANKKQDPVQTLRRELQAVKKELGMLRRMAGYQFNQLGLSMRAEEAAKLYKSVILGLDEHDKLPAKTRKSLEAQVRVPIEQFAAELDEAFGQKRPGDGTDERWVHRAQHLQNIMRALLALEPKVNVQA